MRLLTLALLLLASCSKGGAPDIRISDAWARETRPGTTMTAAYMTLDNTGRGDDRLVRVDAPAPATASVHATETSNGISRMRPLRSGLAMPAGARIELKPGGTHVMIMGLGDSLRAGDRVKLVLHFDKSGSQPIDFDVRPATSGGGL